MSERVKEIGKRASKNIFFWIFSVLSIGLLIAGFITEPPGEIHSSVLIGVSEIFAFGVLGVFIKVIDEGGTAEIHKGDVSLNIKSKKEDID